MANLTGFLKSVRDLMRNDPGISGDAQRLEQIIWMLFLKVYSYKEQEWAMEKDYHSILPENCRWENWAHDDKSGQALTGEALLDFVNNTIFPTCKQLQVSTDTPIRQAIVKECFADTNQYMKEGVLLRKVLNIIDEIDLGDYKEAHAFGEIYETMLKELQAAGKAGEFYTPRAVTRFMAHMIKPRIGERMADLACGTGGFMTSWLEELRNSAQSAQDLERYGSSVYGIEKKQFPYMLSVTNLLLHDVSQPQISHGNALTHKLVDYTEEDKFDVILMNPPYGGSELKEVQGYFPNDLKGSETADLFMAVILYRLKDSGRAAVVLPDGFLFGNDGIKLNIKRKLIEECNLHTVIRLPGSVFSPYTGITTNLLFFDRSGPTRETWFYRLDMPPGYKHFSKTRPMLREHFQEVEQWWVQRSVIEREDGFKARAFSAQELRALGYNLDQCAFPKEESEILPPDELIADYYAKRQSALDKMDATLSKIKALIGGK